MSTTVVCSCSPLSFPTISSPPSRRRRGASFLVAARANAAALGARRRRMPVSVQSDAAAVVSVLNAQDAEQVGRGGSEGNCAFVAEITNGVDRGMLIAQQHEEILLSDGSYADGTKRYFTSRQLFVLPLGVASWLSTTQAALSSGVKLNEIYGVGELFELGIQLSYLLTLLGLLGAGTFFVIRQVLVRRELDLSAKELQEQVRRGDASATEYFELGAVMLRRKFYPAAIKYLQQAIEKWDRDDQDLAQVYNALGVSYVRDNQLDKGIVQFQRAVKIQPGYVTAWNNLGDAYEKKKDLASALRAFDEVLMFDPNNKVARPRRDGLKDRVQLYKGISVKSKER